MITCKECQQGYYRKTSKVCEVVTPIDNCVLYSQTSSNSVCTQCSPEYLLDINGKCKVRSVQNIDYCLSYAINGDYCILCADDYVRTTDNLKCLPALFHCKTYSLSSQINSELVCFQCEDGYYYDITDKLCIQGSIENCKVYNRTANTCDTCADLYYLSAGICL